MDDLLQEFLTETNENLAVLDNQIVTLEQNPNDPALLGSIFRIVHTIKGTCGFLGLPRLESVAHAGENVLGKFRDGVLPVTPAAVSIILESLDTIKRLVGLLEQNGKEPDGDDADLIARLNEWADGKMSGDTAPAAAAPEVEKLNLPPVRKMTPEEEALEAIFNATPGPADMPPNLGVTAPPQIVEPPPVAAAAPPPPPKAEAPKPAAKPAEAAAPAGESA